ncbi:hypothetical protein BKA56DRAFT_584036 [Ilyonectria sp. MPI-CAGE-AT-0026]|nr:hypothetical protein BKA56DRAFT_584036 [Ilyonectria sp. MPI-CAGE-AT-0026]
MDDPSLAWPAWKFDMKRGDLFTKLHEQYNTYPCPIQDADAFHHDIFEISHEANSTAEFHRLANNRRQQRLHELNDALESASFEIIGNPSLIRTPQWQHAIQLFRTNSLDSLVRYFASYLPTDHIWHPLCHASVPVTRNTGPTSTSPNKEGERTGTDDPSGSKWQALSSSSSYPHRLSGAPARDKPIEGNRPVNTMAPSVLFSPSEHRLKRIRPPEASSHIAHDEEIARPGDNMSTTPDSNTLMAVGCRNGTAYNEGVCPDASLPAQLLAKRVKLQSSHAENQKAHQVDCRGIAQPIGFTTLATTTLVPAPLRTTIALTRSIQPIFNGATAESSGNILERCQLVGKLIVP